MLFQNIITKFAYMRKPRDSVEYKYEDELQQTIAKWEKVKNSRVNRKTRTVRKKAEVKAKKKSRRVALSKIPTLYQQEQVLIKEGKKAETSLLEWLNELVDEQCNWDEIKAVKDAKRVVDGNRDSNLGTILTVVERHDVMWATKAKRMLTEAQLLVDTKIVSREYFINRMSEMAYRLYEYEYIDYETYFTFLGIKDFSKVKLNKKEFKNQTKKR